MAIDLTANDGFMGKLATDFGRAYVTDIITVWKVQYASFVMNQTFQQGKSPRRRFGGFHRHGPETWHERLIGLWYPNLKRQVDFGTGRLGARRYLANSFTADFLDEAEGTVYEVDGETHNLPNQRTSDLNKECFFRDRGLNVVRISNSSVESRLADALFWAVSSQGFARLTRGFSSVLDSDLVEVIRPAMSLCVQTCYGSPQLDQVLASIWEDIQATPVGSKARLKALRPLRSASDTPGLQVVKVRIGSRPADNPYAGLWIGINPSQEVLSASEI